MRRKKDTKDDALQEPLDDGVEDPVTESERLQSLGTPNLPAERPGEMPAQPPPPGHGGVAPAITAGEQKLGVIVPPGVPVEPALDADGRPLVGPHGERDWRGFEPARQGDLPGREASEPAVSPRSAAAIAARQCEWRSCERTADELLPVGCDPYVPERQLDPPSKGGWRYLCAGHADRLVVRDWDPGVG